MLFAWGQLSLLQRNGFMVDPMHTHVASGEGCACAMALSSGDEIPCITALKVVNVDCWMAPLAACQLTLATRCLAWSPAEEAHAWYIADKFVSNRAVVPWLPGTPAALGSGISRSVMDSVSSMDKESIFMWLLLHTVSGHNGSYRLQMMTHWYCLFKEFHCCSLKVFCVWTIVWYQMDYAPSTEFSSVFAWICVPVRYNDKNFAFVASLLRESSAGTSRCSNYLNE